MAVQIVLNQAGKPAGDAGFAREDLALGVPVVAQVTGGPYVQVLWTLPDKPIDIVAPAQSQAQLSAPTASTTQITPIDLAGTYLLSVVVDQGFGLGARPEDQARITFYAGPTLNADPTKLPRRVPAFLERLDHNVKGDPIFGALGNLRGWSQEWLRWFAVIAAGGGGGGGSGAGAKAFARVHLTGTTASVVAQSNVVNVVRSSIGHYAVTFGTPLSDALYAVVASARGPTGGSCAVVTATEATGGFQIERADLAGALADADFSFAVFR